MRSTIVLVLLVLAACKDQGPGGPNLVISNESAGATARVVLLDGGGDTVFNRTVAVGAKECAVLNEGEQVAGSVILSPDTIAVTPFWASANNNWADVLTLKTGPELLQTRRSRSSC